MSNSIPMPKNRLELLQAMKSCEQTKGMSVLDHGINVLRHYNVLISVIEGKQDIPEGWRIPEWAFDPIVSRLLMDSDTITEYQVNHDCGKPYVMVRDDSGKAHFPDHASMSGHVWKLVGGSIDAATLMEMDMDAHLLRASDIPEFAQRKQAATLLLTALAEVHANATMFGGFSSTSFKIKVKHLAKRGRQCLDYMKTMKMAA